MCGHLSLHGVRSPADWNRSKQIWHVIKSIIFSCNFSVSSRNFSSWFPNFWYWFCNFAISSLNFWFSFRNFALSSFDFFSSSRKFSFAMTVKGHRTTAWILYRSNPVYTVHNILYDGRSVFILWGGAKLMFATAAVFDGPYLVMDWPYPTSHSFPAQDFQYRRNPSEPFFSRNQIHKL